MRNCAMAHEIALELVAAQASDVNFLLQLREITMGRRLAAAGAPTDRESYLQRIHYHFADARIVMVNGRQAGLFKCFVIPEKNQWYLSQIQIHPDYQNLGIGKRLITHLLEQATKEGRDVGLNVLKTNPARRLYERSGFQIVGENELAFLMEYRG